MGAALPDAVDNELSGGNHGRLSDLVVGLSGVVNVDDDNQPAPEKIPAMTDTPSIISTEWGHEGVKYVSGRKPTIQTVQQFLVVQLTQQEMTSTSNCLSVVSQRTSCRKS